MTDKGTSETAVVVQHVKIETARSFESTQRAFESAVPKLDPTVLSLLGASFDRDRHLLTVEI